MADEPGTGQAIASVPAGDASSQDTSKISASRRVRARLARRMTAQRSLENPVLDPLVAVHRQFHPKADLAILQRADPVQHGLPTEFLRQYCF